MTRGKTGFRILARSCCFVPGSGRIRSLTPKTWCRRHSFATGVISEICEPMALLVTSVRRAALDLARREGRRATREERSIERFEFDVAVFRPLFEEDDRRVAIEQALQRIPSAQREALVLKIWGELTFEQIGHELGISPNTAASRYRYALAALRQQLTAADCHG